MANQYRLKAPVVKVSIGSPDGNRVARILRAGAIVPDGVAAESLEKLAARGFLEEVEIPEADSPEDLPPIVPTVPGGSEQPPADPTGSADSEQLEASPPPKAGQGSSAEAWRTYAAGLGVEVADDASRDDVIAALESAGKPTE